MTQKIAFVFPGQGSQWVGMGKDLYEAFPSAQATFREADEVLGFPLSQLCFFGPEDELRRTINAQPAILTMSIACMRTTQELCPSFSSVVPAFVAGHSLGEYTALFSTGVLEFHQVLSLVRERGRLMEEAGIMNPGGMAAIIGLDEGTVEEICQETGIQIANQNSPGQIAISGGKEALVKAMDLAQARGARRVIPLDVSGAFHSRLMEPASEGMARAVTQFAFHDARTPIVANSTAQPVTKGEAIKEELLSQLCSPVRWQKSIEYMIEAGVTTFAEIGPGKVLTGLIRRIHEEATLLNLGDATSIQEVKL